MKDLQKTAQSKNEQKVNNFNLQNGKAWNNLNPVIPIQFQNDIIALRKMREFYISCGKKEPNSLTSDLVEAITESIDNAASDISGLAGEAMRNTLYYGKGAIHVE